MWVSLHGQGSGEKAELLDHNRIVLCPAALTCQESWLSAAVLELCVCGPHKMGNVPFPQNLMLFLLHDPVFLPA